MARLFHMSAGLLALAGGVGAAADPLVLPMSPAPAPRRHRGGSPRSRRERLPALRLAFLDGAAGERLMLRYAVGRGELMLRRTSAAGRRTLYRRHKWTRARLSTSR